MYNPKLPNMQTVLLPTVYPVPHYDLIGGPWFDSTQHMGNSVSKQKQMYSTIFDSARCVGKSVAN